ncbi:MAG: hypothetical protein OXG83_00320 [Acidobacteria bacterium]|nr:hypothetical protein [Acidobacteriota bacterium]
MTAAVGLLFALPAAAIVYVMPTDEGMVDRSPIIVFGEVLSVQPGPAGATPTTQYLFAVEEVLKGFVAGSGIIVRQPGGVGADGVAMRVLGLPMLAEGNRVLLFLHPAENGAHGIVEYGLGMFYEARVGDRAFLLREPSLRGEVVLPGGQAATGRVRRRGYRDAAAFRRWIADRAAGAGRPADYLARELPEHPTAVVSPFRLTQFSCAAGAIPARWPNFDRGETVGFDVHSRGQPGIAGGGLSLVRAAMRVWNADPGSNVDLEFARTITSPPRLGQLDGDNSITFEDPHDEIEGSYVAGRGGVIALTSTWSNCVPRTVGGLRISEIPEANMATQDGYRSFLGQFDSRTAERAFQNVMAHELGHALGIAHPCEPEESNCDTAHEFSGAVMWWRSDPHRDLGTALHSDDRAAVRRLYPDESHSPAPDLVVESPASTESSVAPGGAFTFAATVRNRGDSRSNATTLRYYRSSDSRITTSDTPVGTDQVSALSASETDRQSIDQQAPATPGTYYYGACVDAVSGESERTNNCSIGVPVSVTGATASCSGDTCLLQGRRFRVKARYSKAGAPSQSAGAMETALAGSAGLFGGDSGSPELLVRIVNHCRTTGYWEVHAGVASDADFSVAVRHVETNELKWFRTRDRRSIADTEAFACTTSDDHAAPADPGGSTNGAPCSGLTCLLQEDRFRVKSWYARDGGSSQAADATSVDLGESAGLFAFDSGNPELLVRIAETCSTSGYWTVYAGTASDADFSVAIRDTETNELKWFRSQGGEAVVDVEAFRCTGSDNGTPPGEPAESPCSGDTCLLQGQRFRVKARYSQAGAPGQSAPAIEAALADSAGLFSGGSGSPELLVRIVNRCRTTGYWEVYAGVASEADFSVAVRDTDTDELRWFGVRDGRSVADTEGFACTDGDARMSTGGVGGADDPICAGATCLLQDDIFRVKAWYVPDGGSSRAAGALSADLGKSSGLFTFDSGHPELLVRVANTCNTNGNWTVYAGAASGADFNVAIRDTDTNELKWFRSRDGQSVVDAEGFACGDREPRAPDLVVSSVSASDASVTAGATFTLSATVENRGNGRSTSTTLRYYRSSDSTISRADSEVGTDAIGTLSASASSAESIDLTVTSTPGTYYYGACVDSVTGEVNADNNCSTGVRVAVGSAVVEYRYDDGDTSRSSWLSTNAGDVHEQEYAQRFRLRQSGTVDHVTVCVARRPNVGNSSRLPFKLTFYRDSGGRPGGALGEFTGTLESPSAGRWRCYRIGGAITAQKLSGGDTWIGLSWLSSTGMAMVVDDRATGSTKLSIRARLTSNSSWIAWQDHPISSVRVFLIRLAVNHGGSTIASVPSGDQLHVSPRHYRPGLF